MGPLAFTADFVPEDEPLLAARANAAELGGTEPVLPAIGAALRFLACAVGAKTVVEIGTGCGSSGIWLLRGMRPGSTLTSVDIEPEYQRLARKTFTQAGFAQNQCRLILGHALEVLPRLSDGTYDMVFCDAEARDYTDYLTAALRLLRPGGIVAFNNALLAGPAEDEAGEDGAGRDGAGRDEAGRDEGGRDEGGEDEGSGAPPFDLTSLVRTHNRLIPMLLPLGDGLLAAVKKGD